jgi:serine-type D-Ala-D-Ala carboxypeptidase/endopeptidase
MDLAKMSRLNRPSSTLFDVPQRLRVWLPRMARAALLIAVTALGVGSTVASAQDQPMVKGDFVGALGPLHLKLHIAVASDGSLTGTLDSPDQGASGLQCTDFHREGQTLSFSVPAVHGNWRGSVDTDGATLTGTWTQGTPMPLTFSRDSFVPAAKPSAVDGIWLGTLQAASQPLRIQVTIKSDNTGQEFCTLDSIDQGSFNLACSNIAYADRKLSFDIPVVHGHWTGELSDDHNTLTGIWNQKVPLPLNLARQSKRWSPPAVTYSPAMAPVDAADMQSVLNGDMAQALKGGALAPATSAGLTIGVVRAGVRRVFAFGSGKPDSIYEIGSITKTFTGLVLAQMVEQGIVKVDEPVRQLLPPGTVAKPTGADITLLDLVTQHSGLHRMPDNFKPSDPDNPYADYRAANLYQFVSAHGLEKVRDPPFLYSNLGVGLADLVGQHIGQRLAGKPAVALSN